MCKQSARKSQAGFTLVELMIVVVIIAVLSMVAIPAYNDSVNKGRRADAKSTLTTLAAKEEQFFMDNKRYTADFTKLGYSASSNVDSIDGHYTVSAVATTTTFELKATPKHDDVECNAFTITELGEQDITGTSTAQLCW